MKRNVVLIETISGTGSGILYPCNYNGVNKQKHIKHYIVFTNMHVLRDIKDKSKDKVNVKGLISLNIYDDAGNNIEENDIISITAFCPDIQNLNKTEDIAAMLIAIKDTISITLETNISSNNLSNREVIFLEGYPGVMLDDDVSQKIQLQGLTKNGFPESKKIGVFQITDDYHWYNNLYDLDLFKGMSGGPVYKDYKDQNLLLGMIQSVSALDEGQNPFKLVYYLRMEFVLEFLRFAGCIIFRKTSETEYLIEWIFGIEQQINNYENTPSFLLIGGSGAGKSSFAKDFAYHGNNLLTTNDGQTTRTTVSYECSIFCEEPSANVEFMNQDEFCERMSSLQGTKPILKLIQKLYNFNEDLVKNEIIFLESFYYLLEELKKFEKESKRMISSIESYIDSKRRGQGFDVEEAIAVYEKIVVILIRYVPMLLAKLAFDVKWIESIKIQFEESYEQQYCSENEQVKWLNKKIEGIINCGDGEIEETYLLILSKYCKGKLSSREYQTTLIRNIFLDGKYSEQEHKRKFDTIKLLDCLRVEYVEELLRVDGFFDVQEFLFINTLNKLELDNALMVDPFPRTESKKNVIEGREGFEIDFWKGMQSIYKSIYQIIKKSICEEYGINFNDFKRKFNIKKMDDKSKRELQLCLQVVSGNSLTGLIRNVKIVDMISNEHAITLYELRIARIKMYDTYGLDHVEGGDGVENTLYSHIYRINENEGIKYKDFNVLYFKKLDAGRPDELKAVLPCVRKVIPQAPVYCVFTGIDIFYKTTEDVKNLQWKLSNEKTPKSVRYILSNRAKLTFNNDDKYHNEKNRNMYLVLRNNLVPYCGDKIKVQNEYHYMKNNEIYVKKMLASIVMKEYSSIEIVDLKRFENLSEEQKKAVDNFIVEIFKRASVNIDGVHWNTIRANIRGIGNQKKLGTWTSYRYQWNQRFHESFAYVVAMFGTELTKQFGDSADAIVSALKNVEDSFLGSADNLYKVNLSKDMKNPFRLYMEEMYAGGAYTYNPYKTDESEFERILKHKNERKKYFSDVFNFAKGLNSNQVLLRKFSNEFIDKLCEEIENDNRIKVENIIHLNPTFAESVDMIKNEFVEKYSLNKEHQNKVEYDFKRVMTAYIESL